MIPFAPNRIRTRQTAIVVIEAVLLFGSLFLAAVIYWDGNMQRVIDYGTLHKGLFITVILMVSFYYNGLYDLSVVKKEPIESIILFLRSFGIGAMILAIAYFFVPMLVIDRLIVLTFLILQMAAITLIRIGIFRWFVTSPRFARHTLIVGTDDVARKIAHDILDNSELGYKISGFASNDVDELDSMIMGVPVVCSYDRIRDFCWESGVGLIVVALGDRRARLPLWQLIDCKMNGVRVEEVTSFYEQLTGRIMVEDIKPSSIIFSDGYRISKLQLVAKRLIDITFSLVGLILASPLLALSSVAIIMNSTGPVFFRQERVGQNGRPFTLVKFRTMVHNAEKESGPVYATPDDPRIDRLGRFLRMARIDEIPQMWNVLRGDMSFVGPRPERQFFIRQLQEEIPFYIQRLAVKPGLTGWAQTRYKYAASREQTLVKLQYDLYYIKNLTIFLDLIIVLDTIRVVLLRKGT